MDENVIDTEFLRGRLVSFTGRFASMARHEATELVEKFGGQVGSGINRQTSFLIVGQEGWPLRKDGRLTQKLQKARLLQRHAHPVVILAEDDWLERLGSGPEPGLGFQSRKARGVQVDVGLHAPDQSKLEPVGRPAGPR